MARLCFDDVSHRYADTWVLRGLDLEVGDGEAHALLGPSGAGKSTLLNLLSGLLTPTSGRILLDDRDVTRARPAARRVAQVFQFPVLYDGLSVRGNLEFPLRNDGETGRAARIRAEEIADLLEIAELLDASTRGLGAYDRQKVAMGRALVRRDVAAVLLDEPLTAVEPSAKWRLRGALKAVRAELGFTMIYVTHDQREALTFADRVSVIADGRILQTDTPERLYDDPGHEFVAHFIGSPGMNLVPADCEAGVVRWPGDVSDAIARDLTGPITVGFRPEDGRATPTAESGTVTALEILDIRPSGLRGGRTLGLVDARLAGVPVRLRQAIDGLSTGPGFLSLPRDRLRLFRDGTRIDPLPEETPHA